jgi:hypothetical protein
MFTEEKNKRPMTCIDGVVHHTPEYVDWLERLAEDKFINIRVMPCKKCTKLSVQISCLDYCLPTTKDCKKHFSARIQP